MLSLILLLLALLVPLLLLLPSREGCRILLVAMPLRSHRHHHVVADPSSILTLG